MSIGTIAGLLAGCGDSETPKTTTFTDLDYESRRFFFLVDPVDPLLAGVFLPPSDPGWIPPPVIDSLQVWSDDRIQSNNGGAVRGVAHLEARPGALAQDSVFAFFDPLNEHADFNVADDLVATTVEQSGGQKRYVYPMLDLLSSLGAGEILAATFRATFTLPHGETRVWRYGAVAQDGTIHAKALYIPEAEYQLLGGDFYSREDYWYPIRRLELRSIYHLRLEVAGFNAIEVSVRQAPLGISHFPGSKADVTYLRGLGVDKRGSHGQSGFDHHIDPEFIRADRDLLILPDLRPFAPAAEDSVWPLFYADIVKPGARPAYFVGEHANAFYDKRAMQINRSEDSKYIFTVIASQ